MVQTILMSCDIPCYFRRLYYVSFIKPLRLLLLPVPSVKNLLLYQMIVVWAGNS